MFEVSSYSGDQKKDYKLLLQQLQALIADETDEVTLLANTSALFNQFLEEINWVGFYIWKTDELVLGPFQGLPACTRIAYGKGVCGTAFEKKQTLRVPDVHAFPGHIACDAASRSEIVIPMIVNGHVYGVLDIDSPIQARFDETDEQYLEEAVTIICKSLENILHDVHTPQQ